MVELSTTWLGKDLEDIAMRVVLYLTGRLISLEHTTNGRSQPQLSTRSLLDLRLFQYFRMPIFLGV
jgi:hypothetical protein